MNKYLSEFIGTLFCAYIIFATGNWLAIGAAFAICILLWNGYYNPAIAVGFLLDKKMNAKETFFIIVSETIGALAGYGLYKVILK